MFNLNFPFHLLMTLTSLIKKQKKFQSLSNWDSRRMAGERMSLCWNKFEETAAAAFRYLDTMVMVVAITMIVITVTMIITIIISMGRYLGASGDFSDVTLASEDGKQVHGRFLV